MSGDRVIFSPDHSKRACGKNSTESENGESAVADCSTGLQHMVDAGFEGAGFSHGKGQGVRRALGGEITKGVQIDFRVEPTVQDLSVAGKFALQKEAVGHPRDEWIEPVDGRGQCGEQAPKRVSPAVVRQFVFQDHSAVAFRQESP